MRVNKAYPAIYKLRDDGYAQLSVKYDDGTWRYVVINPRTLKLEIERGVVVA